MDELRHLFPKETAATEHYTYPGKVRTGEFKVPPRDRVAHSAKLIKELRAAEQQAREVSEDNQQGENPKGVVFHFQSNPEFKLWLQSLEVRPSKIELRNSRIVDGIMHATVFVPQGKVEFFVRKFEAYLEDYPRSKKPKNKNLVESIGQIRLAALESFWTDAGQFPEDKDEAHWWEVWLQGATNPHDVSDVFRERAQVAGMAVGHRELRFPERRVLLARGTVRQFAAVENLFDILAELRLAKILPGEFLQLPPRDQAEFVEEARSRIQQPSENVPAVCHLDTGVNRGHPLLEFALDENHVLAVDPSWIPRDSKGHGTEMAGLALYGCLTTLLDSEGPVVLRHRLESVKIFPDQGANDPDLYGEITSQAASRVEIAAPERSQRAFCLTITADGRDEGFPSSWSGAIDQICSAVGEDDMPRRLIVVSAGNVPLENQHEYPDRNQVEGVEDPAQAWNALTVGAYTDRIMIRQSDYDGWQPIALPGQLSPASRTSNVWADRSWPFKPDIVMEGGNTAIDPSTQRADHVDDLSLLTTRVSATGALLTTTSDTSAATALAARYAAIIWSHYPDLWPETVRGLLVHSARWTDGMLNEFPNALRHDRLRCYGYGVPNLQAAIWSVSNAATLIIQGELQPFEKVENKVKTKDMHLHRLPWPTQVLQDLGESDVRMRVTLSYFIEPSPGRRGWTRKHRYQSFGLRFDIKKPLQTETAFHKSLSKEAWDEDEDEIENEKDDRNWEIGKQLRSKGSIHSDTWTGPAVELANCGVLAIYPVTGWWRERQHLGFWDRKARYALIVSIETPETDIDLYTPITSLIDLPIQTDVQS